MKCMRGETARERLRKIRMYISRVTSQEMLTLCMDRMGWHPVHPPLFSALSQHGVRVDRAV